MKKHKKNYKSHLMNKHEVEAGAVRADTAPGRIHISAASLGRKRAGTVKGIFTTGFLHV